MNSNLCVIFLTFASIIQDFFTVKYAIPNETLLKVTALSL